MNEAVIFLKRLFFNPKIFFVRYVTYGTRPGYFPVLALIIGISSAMDRIDRRLMQLDTKGKIDSAGAINEWLGYWVIAFIAGGIGAIFLYYIGGWIFNLRVKWSGGTDDLYKSRELYVYSSFVSSVCALIATVILTIGNERPYMPDDFSIFDVIAFILICASLVYSFRVAYIGVIATTGAIPKKAMLWFIIIPAILYTLAVILMSSLALLS
ncbi:MAG: YIP1 family protein [Bacteroidetes bacterium]|nr:YIP1 family protein [Bacteroidota bacterium]